MHTLGFYIAPLCEPADSPYSGIVWQDFSEIGSIKNEIILSAADNWLDCISDHKFAFHSKLYNYHVILKKITMVQNHPIGCLWR